jgi:hypothetical protein
MAVTPPQNVLARVEGSVAASGDLSGTRSGGGTIAPMAKMGPAGRYAQREMTAALAELRMTPPPGSVARYAHACDRLSLLRKWEDAGSPATTTGSREQVIAHPLLAEIRYTEAGVTTLAEACGIRSHPGRFKMGDHRAPDRKASPPGSLLSLTDRLRADDAG